MRRYAGCRTHSALRGVGVGAGIPARRRRLAWVASLAVTVRTGTYADPSGMAAAFLTDAAGRVRRGARSAAVPACTGLALAMVLAIVGRSGHGVAAVGAEVVGFVAVVALARRRIGGFTGDVLGAAGVVGETLGLLMLAAKW